MTVLNTERLTLRAARDGDLAPLFAIYSNADAMRYWDSPPHETPQDTENLYNSLSKPGERRYFLWDLEGTCIGTGGIHSGDELGFILHPKCWGHGFAREACVAIISHHFETTSATRIVANADPRNLASVGLLTRLGFQVTGYKRDDIFHLGEWTDGVYLTLPRP